MNGFNDKVNFIWKIAELLRGAYKPEKYGDVILPMAVLRRFDCLLADKKESVLERAKETDVEAILNNVAGYEFSNKSKFDFEKLKNDSDNIETNFKDYIKGFSSNIRTIIDKFEFDKEIKKLEENNLLYLVVKEFNSIDLHPNVVSNVEMGYIFEELIRRFSENAEAGDHYTPREVIELMVNLIFNGLEDEIREEGRIFTVGDFACGTGGMLSVATNYIKKLNPGATVELFGQELNNQSYAVCCSDMLIKGQSAGNIAFGNSLTADKHVNRDVQFALMNPPFGVDWKKDKDAIDEEAKKEFNGRFGAGLPRTSDGSLLFLQHMVSKMRHDEKGSRMAIIFNGSPLFTGDAGSGESEIRRWIIENDLLEGIIALPTDLFYNTGIATYIWIITNRKNDNILNGPVRSGKIQLIDATNFYHKMRKSLGSKRNKISDSDITEITRLYGEFKENEYCKIFDNKDFGYLKVTIERPLKLNFQISEERIENIYSESAFSKLYDEDKVEELELKKQKQIIKAKENTELEKQYVGKSIQDNIIDVLKNNIDEKIYKNREEFDKELSKKLKRLDLSKPVYKAVLMGLSERDETADYCYKGKSKEADSDLRDTEMIPLSMDVEEYNKKDSSKHIAKEKENILNYLEAEVKPHVNEYWIDDKKTKIGYEIPFTRHFYKFEELRPFAEIMKEVEELETEIQTDVKKVFE
ncbi:type I restriction-modification system subunit M [Methanococcus voltae]|uniref:site-specific DNA-methyltransferase (adenine-specific) n=1 Tax=Methanococcus voltae (strain ATCC BAA-1334 / A3) TaxID=456320 RepID=D7DSR4_METV3|nr:class I SAM-dependent DNA methyltransferase [Methanococcus voltae]MCS3901775.1 type I restriction enzyme M protein [Methanococcus voltae]